MCICRATIINRERMFDLRVSMKNSFRKCTQLTCTVIRTNAIFFYKSYMYIIIYGFIYVIFITQSNVNYGFFSFFERALCTLSVHMRIDTRFPMCGWNPHRSVKILMVSSVKAKVFTVWDQTAILSSKVINACKSSINGGRRTKQNAITN